MQPENGSLAPGAGLVKEARLRFFYGYAVVLAGFFLMVIMWGSIYTFGVFFKPLLNDFGWTRAETSGAYSLYMVVHGVLYMVTGRLNDRWGPRALMTVCGVILGLGYLLMSLTGAIWQLYVFYGVVIGIGMSGGQVPAVSSVARWFYLRRGLMTGIVLAGVGLGTVFMPPLASRLITSYGWQRSYVIIGVATIILCAAAAQFLRRDPARMGQRAYGAGAGGPARGNVDITGLSTREAIITGRFWVFAAVFFLSSFCQQSIMVHIVNHATDLKMPAASAAALLTIIGGVSIGGKVLMGGVSDRIGVRPALLIGSVLLTAALTWLVVGRQTWALYLFAVLFGAAYGAMIPLQSPAIAELFGLRAHGALLGVVAFTATLGGAVGPLVVGYLFDRTGNYSRSFVTCVAVSAVSLVLIAAATITARKKAA